MVIRPLLTGLACLALSLCLSGCAPAQADTSAPSDRSPPIVQPVAPAQPVHIPFTLAYYPDYSIHPALADNRANHALVPLLYEGLFAVDDTFQASPLLCEHYTVSEDGLSWTFTLRSGITFSDGTPLTGQLCAQSLNTALAPDSRYHGRIDGLRSITGTELDVVVTLTHPIGELPVLLDIPICLGTGDIPPGTGAYVLSGEGTERVLTARRDWWQSIATPFPSIRLSCIQQADDLIAAFDSGEVTLLDADLTGTNALGYSGSYEAWDYNTTVFLYLGFNTRSGYCTKPEARQAISMGIDREAISTIPFARHAVAATLPVHPDSRLYNRMLADQTAYDPDALVQALKSTPPPSAPLKLVVNSENNAKASAAEYIAYQLRNAGLEVEVEKLPWDNFVAALNQGRFDLYLGEVMLRADFDLSALLSSSGQLNYGRWKDEQTDLLLTQMSASADAQRLTCASALYSYLNTQVPITPICFKNGSVLTQWGRLTGLQPRQNNVFYALDSWTLDE